MSDASGATAQNTSTRRKVSERLFIGQDGKEVESIDVATGARYRLVAGGVNREFDVQLGDAGKPATMLAIFGAHTKFGNVVNTILNDAKEPGSPEDAGAELEAFIDGLNDGKWREPSEGGARAAKYDNAILAFVLHAILGAAAKGDVAHYQQRLEEDKSYRAKVVARDDIKAAYWQEMAKRGVEKPAQDAATLA